MTSGHRPLAFLVILLATACTSCSSFIPTSGPKLADIIQSPEIRVQNVPAPTEGFALVRIDGTTAEKLSVQDEPPRFGPGDLDRPQTAIGVGVGDVLQVTIFETGSGGLFIPSDAGSRPGNFVALPPQQVGQDGAITVPWAGRIATVGRTPITIQAEIEGRLAKRALEPQVVVSTQTSSASLAKSGPQRAFRWMRAVSASSARSHVLAARAFPPTKAS